MLFHHIFFHKFALAQIWYYFDTCIDSWLMQTCLDEILSKVCLSWPDNEQSSAALHSKLSPLSWLITLQTFSVYQTCIPWLMTWRHKHFTGLNTHQKFYPSLCHHWKCFLCWWNNFLIIFPWEQSCCKMQVFSITKERTLLIRTICFVGGPLDQVVKVLLVVLSFCDGQAAPASARLETDWNKNTTILNTSGHWIAFVLRKALVSWEQLKFQFIKVNVLQVKSNRRWY